jgi:hypothetical protein
LSGMSVSPEPILPHPFEISARWPVWRTASNIVFVNFLGLSTTIDPNPMYIGGCPAFKKASSSSGGSYSDSVDRN